jgi:hypothetical protein
MSKALCLAVAAALLALLSSCSDGPTRQEDFDPCDADSLRTYSSSVAGVIGPKGGSVEVTHAGSSALGVRVEVPPGAWSKCYHVVIRYESLFDTPDYPDGFVPFERPGPSGSVEVMIGRDSSTGFVRTTDPLPFKLSFPMKDIHPEDFEIRAAYYYDDAQKTWRIVAPSALGADRLTVSTGVHDKLWSWGRVNLADIDFAKHMKPAMEAYLGSSTWAAIEAKLEEAYRKDIEQQDLLTCAGLKVAQGVLVAAKDTAAKNVNYERAKLDAEHHCGGCDPLAKDFIADLAAWLKLKIATVVAKMAAKGIKGGGWIGLALKLSAYCIWLGLEAKLAAADCDYECYFKNASLELHLYTAMYWASYGTSKVIDLYRSSGKISCP